VNAYTAEQAAQIDWASRWRAYGLPSRFWNLGLGHMERSPTNARALDMAQGMVDTWEARRIPPLGDAPAHKMLGLGQIYIGAYATGKTRLACATASDIARRYSTTVLYMPVTEFFALGRKLAEAKDTAVRLGDSAALEEVSRIRRRMRLVETVPLLVWDDMGKEYASASGWTGTEVYRILRLRFDHNRPTIATTNVPLQEWNEKYDGSMFSFLHEAFDAVVLKGEDRRRAGK
jgi:hypothetical protein